MESQQQRLDPATLFTREAHVACAVPTRFDTLLKMLPLTTTMKERYGVTPMDVSTPQSGETQRLGLSPTVVGTIEDDLSPTIVVDDSSPTDTDWSPKRDLSFPPPAIHEPTVPFELSGTTLFDEVREQFRGGISTLDNLLRYMEHSGPARCKGYRRGIDSLLENLVAMAKWLVGFLETARTADSDANWTRSAVVGLRVDLHQYSWKVMKLTMLLRQVGVYDAPKLQL